MLNIINGILGFLGLLTFMILIIAGLAHRLTDYLQIQKYFDRTDNNPAKNYVSFILIYDWINNTFLHDVWDFWAAKFFTLFGSIFLIIILQVILQNIFAFMW